MIRILRGDIFCFVFEGGVERNGRRDDGVGRK